MSDIRRGYANFPVKETGGDDGRKVSTHAPRQH
jgi:hypothetical protein